MPFKTILIICSSTFFFLSCGLNSEKNKKLSNLKYAETFHFENDRLLIVDTPWPRAKNPMSYKLDKPFNRIICTSTSHLPYFEMLGKVETVVGFSNVSYISSEVFLKRVQSGDLVDIGPEGNINLELLVSLQPEAVITFDRGRGSTNLNKIRELGIPVIYNADYLEKSPLGRAEYIRFFGMLLGEKNKADSIFKNIEADYWNLVKETVGISEKPTILNGVVYGDTWFMPGGKNWASVFYKNAGAQYLWEEDTTSGWLELSFEAVYEKGRMADFWIGTSSFNSKKEMIDIEPRYANFNAFKVDKVYNYSKRRNPTGGYDFFESAYARPDLVLADLIRIIHPELLPDYETYYFEKLK